MELPHKAGHIVFFLENSVHGFMRDSEKQIYFVSGKFTSYLV